MAIITIIGAGAMGSAFSVPCTDRGHEVRLVGTHLDDELVAAIDAGRPHPRIGVAIPRERLTVGGAGRLSDAVADADLVVVAVNSLGIQWAIERLGDLLERPVPLLLLTKGLHAEDSRLVVFPDLIRRELARRVAGDVPIMAIGGPSIARELAERRDTSVVLAGNDGERCAAIAAMLTTDYYHIRTSSDAVGVEVAAAFKNLYALAVGICEADQETRAGRVGGPVGFNPAAAVFAQAIAEIAYLARAFGGSTRDVYGLAGVGDLYVTSRRGRNRRAGALLASGISWSDVRAHQMPDDTIEGAELAVAIAPTLRRLMQRGTLDASRLPLLSVVVDTVVDGRTPQIPWSEFFD